MDSDKHYDRRTTPKHLQVPYVLGLYVLAIFFMGCFHFSMAEKRPRWSYWGAFHMFTTKSTNNYQLDGEAYVNGRWESLSLEEMYPTRWESGHRYQRGPFRRSKIRMRTLAAVPATEMRETRRLFDSSRNGETTLRDHRPIDS